jgi:ribonuclease BN (tRNA processing enzyme)
VLAQLSHEPFHPVPLEAQDIEVRDLPKEELELPATRVHLRRQDRHSAPTLGLRFDDRLTWITDTAFDEDSAAFAARSQMLAHEAWYLDSEPRNPDIHSSAHQAARIGADAGIERMLLIHLPPFGAPLDQLLLEAQAQVPHTLLATDGADVSELLLG